MKKKNKKSNIKVYDVQVTKEEQQQAARVIGCIAAIFAKALLRYGQCEVDFKINGEDISDIEKLHGLDVSARIELAVKEERYEDAAKLKKVLEAKNNINP